MMTKLMWTIWFLPAVIGVLWFGVCFIDFIVIRPRKGRQATWIEIVIAVAIGIFLVIGMIPTVDHFRAPDSTHKNDEIGANNTPEDIRR